MNSVDKTEKTSVQVVLRIRPITNEDTSNLPTRFQRQVLTIPPHIPNQVVVQGQNDKKPPTFSFDHVYGPETKQQEIFENSILSLIDQFLEGYNVTILAYGQTSSGKTHTMGTTDNSSIPSDSKGIIPRAMESLFSTMISPKYKLRNFSIKVSFVEIYNEDLIDLLADQMDESKPQVMIREDSKGNILLSGLQEMKVNNADEVMTHLSRGSLNRQVGATDMNSQSSRSHAIFSVIMSQQRGPNVSSSTPRTNGSRPPSRSQARSSKRFDDVESVTITSKFHFVDLAGSERLKRTSAMGDRVKEGISINSGLLALGNVISALGDPNKAKYTTHIPYRDSKLTRLLQDSLGGNAQTMMIACVSPTEYNLNETINTLKYANRARNIKNSAFINQEETGWNDLEHLQSLVLKLRSEIKSLRSSNSISDLDDMFSSSDSGRSTPVQSYQKGDSSKISQSMITNVLKISQKDKDIEALEEELLNLQRAYADLLQKYNDEILSRQINGQSSNQLDVIKEEDDIDMSATVNFQKAVEPIIEEYEKSISSLESQLALSRAAASHTETVMQEQESINEQNFDLINDLKSKIATLSRRETSSEEYIKELESRLEKYTNEENKDQEIINELKNNISQFKTDDTNTQSYISDLETRLASSDQQVVEFTQLIEKLEKRLQQRDYSFSELESKMKSLYTEEDVKLLKDKLEDRDGRILSLEKKVDELLNELELLKRLKDDNVENINLSLSNLTPTTEQEKLIITTLEGKLGDLHKVHEQTINEYDEIKIKYEGCLQEIHELQIQLNEARFNQSDSILSSIPPSPITSTSSLISSPNSVRMSLPVFNKEGNKDTLNFINAMIISKRLHSKAVSLSAEMIDKENKNFNHDLIVQKLQKEIEQLESLHEDKSSGLEFFKQEFSSLENTYRETLEILEGLREEIKRRDALAQLEVMSVMKSDNNNEVTSDTSEEILTNEIDENEIIKRLRKEVENLREEQKNVLESISEREKEIRDKGIQVVNLASNIRKLREQLCPLLEEKKKSNENCEENNKLISELQAKVKDLEEQLEKAQEEHKKDKISEDENSEIKQKPEEVDEEIIALKSKVEKLQAEIEAKSHAIAVLLLPNVELQETIHKLEDELQEVKQAHGKALEEKNNVAAATNSETTTENQTITSDDNDNNDDNDDNVKELEDKIKNLESQLIKAKEVQSMRVPRITMKPTRETVEILHENLFGKTGKIDKEHPEQGSTNDLKSELDKLKFEISEKYELIEILKRDLADKDDILQKLREKEAEASSLRIQLTNVKSRDEDMQKHIKQLQVDVERKGNDETLALQSELESVRKELKNSKEKETFALERWKMLDEEESKLRQEMKRLRHVELLQKERITVLESRFSKQNFGRLNDDVFKLKNELETAKETEMLQRKKITDLESKLEKSVQDYTSLRTKIDYVKSKVTVNRNKIIERESRLFDNESPFKIRKLKEEIETLRSQETENLKKIESLEAQLIIMKKKTDVTSLKDELSELKIVKLNLEKKVQDLESKLSIAQKESEKLKMINDEIKLLKDLESEQKSTIEKLQVQLQETTFAKNSVIKELEDVKIDFSSQKKLIVKLENELLDVKEKLSIATENYDSSSKKLEDLSKKLKDTLSQRDEEAKKVNELEAEVEDLKLSTAAGKKDNATLRYQIADSKLEMEKQNQLLAKLGAQFMNIEKERDQYVSQIKDLKRTLEIKEMEQVEAISNLESVISNLQIQLVENENSLQNDTKTIKRLKEKLSNVETQFNKAKASDKRRAERINELENKLKETDYALNEKEQIVFTQNNVIQELEGIVEKTQIELENAKKSKVIESELVKKLEVELYELSTKYENNENSNNNNNNLDDNLIKIKEELEKVRDSESKQAELIRTLEIQLKEAENNRDQEMFKLQEAIAEIKVLKLQYNQLKGRINEENNDSSNNPIYMNIDSSTIEDLAKQLEEYKTESRSYRDRVEELEILARQLESDKTDQMTTNANLLHQVEQLQKELESLTEELNDSTSKNDDNDASSSKIKMRNSTNLSIKNNNEPSNLAFAKLTEVNNNLRKNNEDLTAKILQAKNRMNTLSQRIKLLESELMSIRLLESNASSNDDESDLKEKIRELEIEKERLKQDNSSVNEERNKLDQKIKSLLKQLESLGQSGNGTALQLSELNNKIIGLEKEISNLKDTSKMEKEVEKLSEINEKLGKEIEKNETKTIIKHSSMPSQDSTSPTVKDRPRITSFDDSIQTKFSQQETTISEQENLIKLLKEKILELEARTDESAYVISEANGMLDLDAVGGGSRISTKLSATNLSEITKTKNKKSNISAIANYPITPPTTPPPSQSLSSIIMANSSTSPESRTSIRGFSVLSPPPRNINSPSPTPGFDLTNAQPEELRMEIQKLQKRIAKMEGEKNTENNGNLENSLKESETNLRVAKQQLQILQREKTDFLDQIKKLRSQLDETNLLFESTKSSVQEEKKVIETVLEEERRAKENAEKARRQLENRMEELMAKRSKFMCF